MGTRRGLAALALGMAFGLLPCPPFANAALQGDDSGLANRARLGVSAAAQIQGAMMSPDGRYLLTKQD